MELKQPEQSQAIRLARIFRVILIGIFLFIVWSFSPIFMGMGGGHNPFVGLSASVPAEQMYRDKSGKRIRENEYHTMLGYDAAKERGITSHAACKAMVQVYQAQGCHRYVTEQKHIPEHIPQRDFGNGKSTEQCRTEVNAYYEPLIQDAREKGDERAAAAWTSRRWMPELSECENYDHIRIGKVIHEPAARLNNLLKKVEQGGVITEQDRIAVKNDLVGVLAFPDDPYRQAYIQKSDYFFRIADGEAVPPLKQPLRLTCEEFQAKLDNLANAERENREEQARLKLPSGVITDGARWDALNKARIDQLGERSQYLDGAKASDCHIAIQK